MFYIIDKLAQLARLNIKQRCFIHVVPYNYNYHPVLQKRQISLIYIKEFSSNKGYIIAVKHNEAQGIELDKVMEFINKWELPEIWVLNKKDTLQYFDGTFIFGGYGHLIDANAWADEMSFTGDVIKNNCIDHYYKKHPDYPEVNCIIPISKHYESLESIADSVQLFKNTHSITNGFHLRNEVVPTVFSKLESQGIKIDKTKFIQHFGDRLKHPEYNIHKGKIYTQYNIYTTTGRPSNHFNEINFAALSKTNGEREAFIPENSEFVEFDFNGYHPRILASILDYRIPTEGNIYEHFASLMGTSIDEIKQMMFQQLYGGINKDNLKYEFFNKVNSYTKQNFESYVKLRKLFTGIRNIHYEIDMTPNKLLNYMIQAQETILNMDKIVDIMGYIKYNNLKTRLVLYTYDSFLFDLAYGEESHLRHFEHMLNHPVNIKRGTNYGCLTKTDNIYV
jgi:hypothetical protein